MTAAALNVVGMQLDMLVARTVPGIPQGPHIMSILFGLALLIVLVAWGRNASARVGSALFLLNALVIVLALWSSNAAYAESGHLWVPFQASKLGMFTVALLAPDAWAGVLGIVMYAASSIVQNMTFSEMAHSHMAVGEPIATLAIGGFAMALLAYRIRADALQRDVARAVEESFALERLAAILLEVRDLRNTPLQTIELSSALIREAHPHLQPALDRIDRAIERLKALDTRLKTHEEHVVWTPHAQR
jgi:hypothetical protein